MAVNPFIELFRDPIAVLTTLGYALFLIALTIWTFGAVANLADRGWKHLVWLGNAWEWKHTDQRFGPEWDWYLPPKEVANRVTILGLHTGLLVFLLAIDAWAIGAVVYVLTP